MINVTHEGDDDDEAEARPPLEATPSAPSDDDVAAIKALVSEVMRRAG